VTETVVSLAGLPLAVAVAVFAHHAGRRWWAWLLLSIPLTPVGAAVVLGFIERAKLAELWRKRTHED